jgi:hypothetical protein
MWLVLSSLLLSLTGQASVQCQTTRLDASGQAFAKIPSYDQNAGDVRGQDICYSIVDSYLIDAWRFRRGDALAILSSPLSIAFNHKSSLSSISPEDNRRYSGPDEGSYLGPGNPMLALLTNRDRPVCDQKWLDNFAHLISSSTPTKSSTVHDFLVSTMDQIREINTAQVSVSNAQNRINEFYNCRVSAGLTSVKNIFEAARASLNSGEPISQMTSYLSKICGDHSFVTKIPRPEYIYGPDLTSAIRAQIEKSIPVGLMYCGEVLEGQRCNSANHTSVVIGTECCENSCRYLLRDSVKVNREIWLTDAQIEQSASGAYWLPE